MSIRGGRETAPRRRSLTTAWSALKIGRVVFFVGCGLCNFWPACAESPFSAGGIGSRIDWVLYGWGTGDVYRLLCAAPDSVVVEPLMGPTRSGCNIVASATRSVERPCFLSDSGLLVSIRKAGTLVVLKLHPLEYREFGLSLPVSPDFNLWGLRASFAARNSVDVVFQNTLTRSRFGAFLPVRLSMDGVEEGDFHHGSCPYVYSTPYSATVYETDSSTYRVVCKSGKIIDLEDAWDPVLSPDGRYLAYVEVAKTTFGYSNRLQLLDLAGAVATTLSSSAFVAFPGTMVFSADSANLFYQTNNWRIPFVRTETTTTIVRYHVSSGKHFPLGAYPYERPYKKALDLVAVEGPMIRTATSTSNTIPPGGQAE